MSYLECTRYGDYLKLLMAIPQMNQTKIFVVKKKTSERMREDGKNGD